MKTVNKFDTVSVIDPHNKKAETNFIDQHFNLDETLANFERNVQILNSRMEAEYSMEAILKRLT